MGLTEEIKIDQWPKIKRISQKFPKPKIEDVKKSITQGLADIDYTTLFKRGDKIAITAGSRNIDNIVQILRATIDKLLEIGVQPYVIAAMGSHGGATLEGQKDILDSLGITEETMGVRVVYDTEWEQIGTTDNGLPVFFSKEALKADGIVVVNRIKRHTNIRGQYESGLLKMLVVGMGKHKGALTIHSQGFDDFSQNLLKIGEVILQKVNVRAAIGIVENAYDETARIEVMRGSEILKKEKELLVFANKNVARIPFNHIDILVICNIGKDISGDGMDPNIIGRYFSALKPDYAETPRIKRIVALDLTEKSHGSAVGVSNADVITKRLYEKIDTWITYTNAVTATAPEAAKIPVVMPNDRMAIEAAVKTCTKVNIHDLKLCIIKNTLQLDELYASVNMINELCIHAQIEQSTEEMDLPFDQDGNLTVFNQ